MICALRDHAANADFAELDALTTKESLNLVYNINCFHSSSEIIARSRNFDIEKKGIGENLSSE